MPKKVLPLGGGAAPKVADSPPVSELESPKLNTAGKRQSAPAATETCDTSTSTATRTVCRPGGAAHGTLDFCCCGFVGAASMTPRCLVARAR
ncbi:Os07g0586266, partial [Oryza sativa Japonica Group]